MQPLSRRLFLQLTAIAGLPGSEGRRLEAWTPGTLEIHQLAYGRGNAAFILCPDGTTMLIDAGTNEDALTVSCPQRPSDKMRPGEWIASYVLRHMQPAGRRELDYAIITHIHPDHLGDVGPENPVSSRGDYRLTGITDVAERVPVSTLVDRGYPSYDFPAPPQAPFAVNYRHFVEWRRQQGGRTERIRVGSVDQIRLRQASPNFAVRVLAGNGEVWTGKGNETRRLFPSVKGMAQASLPSENICSIALRISYGKFDFYTGGDLTCDTEMSGDAWRDVETPVAAAAGPVEVAVANHHAYLDAVGENFVRSLDPQAFIIPAWYVAHPAALPLRRMVTRDVYSTCIMGANRVVNNQFLSKLKSMEGHIVVRVAPGGEQFRIIVTDNTDDSDRITYMSGAYQSR